MSNEWIRKSIYLLNCAEIVYQYWISALSQRVREYRYSVSLHRWGYWGMNLIVLYVWLFDLNDLIRVCIDMVFWNSIILHYLIQDGIFMSWSVLHCIGIFLVFHDYGLSQSRWYFCALIIDYLDREDIFMSRLRGYFQPDLDELDLYLVKCFMEWFW